MSSNVLHFPGRAVDIVSHHQISWSLVLKWRSYTWGRIRPLAVLDSKKRGLLRVKVIVYQMSLFKCSDLKVREVICFTLPH